MASTDKPSYPFQPGDWVYVKIFRSMSCHHTGKELAKYLLTYPVIKIKGKSGILVSHSK